MSDKNNVIHVENLQAFMEDLIAEHGRENIQLLKEEDIFVPDERQCELCGEPTRTKRAIPICRICQQEAKRESEGNES